MKLKSTYKYVLGTKKLRYLKHCQKINLKSSLYIKNFLILIFYSKEKTFLLAKLCIEKQGKYLFASGS